MHKIKIIGRSKRLCCHKAHILPSGTTIVDFKKEQSTPKNSSCGQWQKFEPRILQHEKHGRNRQCDLVRISLDFDAHNLKAYSFWQRDPRPTRCCTRWRISTCFAICCRLVALLTTRTKAQTPRTYLSLESESILVPKDWPFSISRSIFLRMPPRFMAVNIVSKLHITHPIGQNTWSHVDRLSNVSA